jgi:hypothetical protein
MAARPARSYRFLLRRKASWCDPRSSAEEPWDWRLTFPGDRHGSHVANGKARERFRGHAVKGSVQYTIEPSKRGRDPPKQASPTCTDNVRWRTMRRT